MLKTKKKGGKKLRFYIKRANFSPSKIRLDLCRVGTVIGSAYIFFIARYKSTAAFSPL
jgi:hypothetical protein